VLDGFVSAAVARRYLGVIEVAERRRDVKALFVVPAARYRY